MTESNQPIDATLVLLRTLEPHLLALVKDTAHQWFELRIVFKRDVQIDYADLAPQTE